MSPSENSHRRRLLFGAIASFSGVILIATSLASGPGCTMLNEGCLRNSDCASGEACVQNACSIAADAGTDSSTTDDAGDAGDADTDAGGGGTGGTGATGGTGGATATGGTAAGGTTTTSTTTTTSSTTGAGASGTGAAGPGGDGTGATGAWGGSFP